MVVEGADNEETLGLVSEEVFAEEVTVEEEDDRVEEEAERVEVVEVVEVVDIDWSDDDSVLRGDCV